MTDKYMLRGDMMRQQMRHQVYASTVDLPPHILCYALQKLIREFLARGYTDGDLYAIPDPCHDAVRFIIDTYEKPPLPKG
jgi:hypothetical protein